MMVRKLIIGVALLVAMPTVAEAGPLCRVGRFLARPVRAVVRVRPLRRVRRVLRPRAWNARGGACSTQSVQSGTCASCQQ